MSLLTLATTSCRVSLLFFLVTVTCFAQGSSQPPPANPPYNVLTNGSNLSDFAKSDTSTPGTSVLTLTRAADQAAKNRDYSTCAQLLEKVISIDPKAKNAYNYLGWTYNSLGQYQKAEAALRKAIEQDPNDPRAYNNLGQALAYQKKYDEAIPQYRKQIELNPKDIWAYANLGRVYIIQKKYVSAISELNVAATITPEDPNIAFNLGRAYAKASQPENAERWLVRAAELQPIPARLNGVAYEMAESGLNLTQAEKYSQSSIVATMLQMHEISLDRLTREDTFQTARLAAYWDTWAWIQFKKNDLAQAEKYMKATWHLAPTALHSDHLGQIEEKAGRRAEAQRLYQMSMGAESSIPETRERLIAIAGPTANIEALIEEGHKLLKEASAISIPNPKNVEGFAEYWVMLSPGPVVRGVKFISGDEELSPLSKDIEAATFPDVFPEATEIRIVRWVRLSCVHSSPDCRLQFSGSFSVPEGELPSAPTSIAGNLTHLTLSRSAENLRIIKKVPPIYPLVASSAHIDGTVRLHAIIGKDGKVRDLSIVGGPPALTGAAMDAVKQWVYEPVYVEGLPVEVETTIDVIFQLKLNH
jgi:TonB family protein